MIVELFKDIVSKVSENLGYDINYMFGDSSYIREQMFQLGKSYKSVKYPLIALYTPIEEYKSDPNYYCKASVGMIIAVSTSKNYSNEQRLEASFVTMLRPIYDVLMNQILLCEKLDFGYSNHVSHTYTENYVFGRRGALDSDGKELEEKIDAIEIKTLELKIKKTQCYAKRY